MSKVEVRGVESIRLTRKYLIGILDGLSIEQLNKTPVGFNNNIIWNLGHLIATQQRLCYIRAGLSPTIDQQFISEFQVGTRPDKIYDNDAYHNIVSLLLTSLDGLEEDIEKNHFTNFTPFDTPYGVVLNNIEEAIDFLAYHEGMHCGYVMALKRLV